MTDRPDDDGAPHQVPPDLVPRVLRALDRSPATIVSFIDSDLHTRWISQSSTWIGGTDPNVRMGRESLERVHPDDVARLLDGLATLQDTAAADTPGGGAVLEPIRYRIQRPDGSWQTMETLVHNLLHDPLVRGMVLVGRPVGGALDGVGHVVDLLVAGAPLAEVLAACAGLVPEYLGAAAVVARVEEGMVVGTPEGSGAERLCDDDRWWRGTMADGRARAPADFAGFPDDLAAAGRDAGFRSAWVLPLADVSSGEVMGCVVVWTRVPGVPNIGTDGGLRQTERLASLVIGEHRHRHALRREALTDPLTGIGNRSALRRRLDEAPGPVTVAMVDLDDFKPVNDTLGHDAGDAVLRVVAERLVRGVREVDLVVRLGGDEFVIVFADGASAAGSSASAHRVARMLAMPIDVPGAGPVSVGASVGIATGSAGDVVRLADAALYEAKRAKRSGRRPKRQAGRWPPGRSVG